MTEPTIPFTVSVIVEDKPGVMQRISAIFARRSVNLDSITVGRIAPGRSRMTLAFQCDDLKGRMVISNLRKLFQVMQVDRLDPDNSIPRELALAKIRTPDRESKLRIMRILDDYGARVLYTELGYIVAELSGSPQRIDAVLKELGQYAIEVARSGIAAIVLD